jgi:biopolymer transport protein ExbB
MSVLGSTLFRALTLAQDAGADPEAARQAAEAVQVQSVWDFIVKGGPVMIPIILCSLVAMAVVAERLINLRRRNVIPASFLPGLTQSLGVNGEGQRKALEYCRNNDSPVARVFAAGIKRLGEPVELLERHITEAGEREAIKLRKYLRVLQVIAAVAPLLGLLGTIFGMINAFQTVAVSGEALGKTEMLAEGIYQAMITTAAGLIVAIPVLICYHWISAKIDSLVMDLDRMTVDFVEEHAEWAAPTHGVSSQRAPTPRLTAESVTNGAKAASQAS